MLAAVLSLIEITTYYLMAKKMISVSMDVETIQKVKIIAKKEKRSISQTIDLLVISALKDNNSTLILH